LTAPGTVTSHVVIQNTL